MRISFLRMDFTVLLLFLFVTGHSRAQPQALLVDYPADGSRDISLNTSIVVRSPLPIDSGSISFRYPDVEASGYRFDEPVISLYPVHDTNGTKRRWRDDVVKGTYHLDDRYTLRFTPRHPLHAGTTYRCVVRGLRQHIDAGATFMDSLAIVFTTRFDAPHLWRCSMDTMSALRCTDSIRLSFDGDMLPWRNHVPGLISVERMMGGAATERLQAGIHVSEDGTDVFVTPLPRWPSGCVVKVTCRLSEITGSTVADKVVVLPVRQAGRIVTGARSVDGSVVPPDVTDVVRSQERLAIEGESLRLTVPVVMGGQWRFVRWESELLADIDGGRDATIDLPMTCDMLAATMPVTAVVERIPSKVVIVTGSIGGRVMVRDGKGTVLRSVGPGTRAVIDCATVTMPMIVHAVPDRKYAFSHWETSIASMVSTSSVMMIPSGGTTQQPVLPRFTPRPQPPARTFRLKADVQDMDADPLFDVRDGVKFTTVREHTEGIKVQRTVCVQAGACWEIAGHTDVSAGATIWYDAPKQRACVTSWLIDPENRIVFHCRRSAVRLRIDKIMLASDVATDIIAGRSPHPETIVDLERRVQTVSGPQWQYVTTPICTMGGIAFSTYGLRCGDNVRITIRASQRRGEHWQFWSDVAGYVRPSGEERANGSVRYTMVIDRDMARFNATACGSTAGGGPEIRVRACFRLQFGIDGIGVRMLVTNGTNRGAARFVERWLDPLIYHDLLPDEPIGGRQLEYVPRLGTPVKVRYTTSVDIRTIHAGAMIVESYGNVLVNDPMMKGLDFTVASSSGQHIQFHPSDGRPADIVEFRVCDPSTTPRKQALHLGNVLLTCGTDVRSLRGLPLAFDNTFVLSTVEAPGYGLFLQRVGLKYDGDWDLWPFEMYGEPYHAVYGGVLGVDRAYETEPSFARLPECDAQQGGSACTYSQSDKDSPMDMGGKTLLFQPFWMDLRDYAFMHIQTYDEDCKSDDKCLVNRVRDLLDVVRKRAESYKGSPARGISWENNIGDLITIGAEFIRTLLPQDDQDDHLGSATFLENIGTVWGVRSDRGAAFTLYGGDASYEVLTRLYPRRAVIR